jgi:prepilin-type N-terminal cleavage/methylation domain-containing protein/prepilin-type processing-associated H-X9-DG protein
MPINRRAFTLIELLVVVAIIALLIAVLLPSLGKARAIARAVKCAAGLHAVGQAVAGYCAENDNVFPASYLYPKSASADPVDPMNQGDGSQGYQHWSYYLFNQVKDLTAFTCPEFERGGIPRSNPGPNPQYWMAGQSDTNVATGPTATSLEDKQAPFMAFTANAALIPRNKFTSALVNSDPTESGTGSRVNVFVKRTSLTCGESTTILLTEFNTNWKTIATPQGSQFFARGHRPINPFYNLGSGTLVYGNNLFFNNVSVTALDDVDTLNNASLAGASLITDASTILNAVGRNHPGSTAANGKSYGGSSNFLYVDGHTERKSVVDTLKNKEWGDRFYSVSGDNSVH